MILQNSIATLCVIAACVLAYPGDCLAWADDEATAAEQLFALKVRPLLRSKCEGCHGEKPDELESGFDIRSRESLLRGGDEFGGKVLVPGDAKKSLLYAMVLRTKADYEMPPKEAEKLTEEETRSVRDWINGGAPWLDDRRVAEIYKKYAQGITWKTSGGLSDEWTNRKYKPEDLWAYRPLWTDKGEMLKDRGRSPIDVLIDARLAKAKLKPAPAADRRTLIRRATFDLLGLPPSPSEVRKFVDDPRSDDKAFTALIDQLLENPHYGEQWGRHWLDVVRYADSSGFANDWERPNAWRYRDYVIRSFNEDKPYDEFIREQIAGDEIYERRKAKGVKPDASLLIAAGFLRMGPWEHTGMSVAKVTRQQFLDDVTDSVGQVFLAHALQCCRCHDHKFDPIPTRDYYSIQAAFATTQFAEVDAPWLASENLNGMKEDKEYHQKRQQANSKILARLSAKKREGDREWFKKRGLPYKTRQEAKKAGEPGRNIPPPNVLLTPDDFGQERIARKWQMRFPWEMDRYSPIAFSVYNGKTKLAVRVSTRLRRPKDAASGKPERTHILKGGDVFAPDATVSPGALSAEPSSSSARIPSAMSGRRTALAEWIASPKNTLTARVMANRIWQHHFGRGIASNANNFGATGKKPTHPKLLDWLAAEFIKNGWSIKKMHRAIMLSDAYRRSSVHPDAKAFKERDPTDELYASFRPRRLTAEELRDAMLTVSGELNREQGGIPVRPDVNLEAALQPRMIMGTFAPSYVPNPKPAQRNRRTVYALTLRGHRDPYLETFNQPGSEKSCEIRDSSTITPQALTLLNSEETNDRALAFAANVAKEAMSDEAAIEAIFRRAYGRQPDRAEQERAIGFWKAATKRQAKIKYEPRKWPTEVVRRANEENTGKPFTFTERLFAYDDYVPDLGPHQVDARTRGLADLCLAILNSNEFVYID